MKKIIVDVGAGLKNHYDDLFKQYPGLVIHAIEPHPELCEDIRKMVANNTNTHLIVHAFAINDGAQSECDFFMANDRSSSSTLPFCTENLKKWKYPIGRKLFQTTKTIRVVCKSLQTFIHEQKINRIDFLNIDVQGNSLDVLNSLSANDWNRIHEINIKVHNIDFEIYRGQTLGCDIIEKCRKRYFTLKYFGKRTRDQEDIFGFVSELATAKNMPIYGFSRKCMDYSI